MNQVHAKTDPTIQLTANNEDDSKKDGDNDNYIDDGDDDDDEEEDEEEEDEDNDMQQDNVLQDLPNISQFNISKLDPSYYSV